MVQMAATNPNHAQITASRLTPAIGAEISGVSLSEPLTTAQVIAIRQLLLDHKVIFFRDQYLDQKTLLAFAKNFGELEIHPSTPKDQVNPEILRLEHGPNSRGKENGWHSDVTWREEPSLGSVLSAVTIPEIGGDTLFANMNLAYERLPSDIQDRITGLTATHDIARIFAKKLGKTPEELHDDYPPQKHPVVRTHPETGEPLLFVNSGFTIKIDDVDPEESKELLSILFQATNNPEIQCRFKWTEGAVAFWDNRATQHFAASDYFPAIRIMERATIKGDRPYFDASSVM